MKKLTFIATFLVMIGFIGIATAQNTPTGTSAVRNHAYVRFVSDEETNTLTDEDQNMSVDNGNNASTDEADAPSQDEDQPQQSDEDCNQDNAEVNARTGSTSQIPGGVGMGSSI